jgi:hypothetical protein
MSLLKIIRYVSADGQLVTNDYVADENGFRSNLAPTLPKDNAYAAHNLVDVHDAHGQQVGVVRRSDNVVLHHAPATVVEPVPVQVDPAHHHVEARPVPVPVPVVVQPEQHVVDPLPQVIYFLAYKT